jgi:uncharacterized protein (DUF1697 family)
MPGLPELFDALGYTDIATCIESGNIVFTAAARGRPRRAALTGRDSIRCSAGAEATRRP